MLDKFQKLFGPNSEQRPSGNLGADYAGTSLDEATKKTDRRGFRRRVVGFIAFVLFLCAVLPWVFEPAEEYASRGAQTQIGTPSKVPYAQRMSIAPKASETAQNTKKAEEVARNLSQANPPASGVTQSTPRTQEKASPVKSSPVKAEPAKAAASGQVKTAKKPPVVRQASATKAPAEKDKAVEVSGKRYYIQIVATSNKASAVERAARIRKLGLPVYIEKTQRHKSDLWRVRVGRFDSMDKARAALDKLALNSVTNGGVMTEKPAKKP